MLHIENILAIGSHEEFERVAMAIFAKQAHTCKPYSDYLSLSGVDIEGVRQLDDIPFMPIELFKSQRVYCGTGESEIVFTSSTTGGGLPSKHYMERVADYEKTFRKAFSIFYGSPADISIYALLPGYLQRTGSSLIYMVDRLINASKSENRGGFYLDDYPKLIEDMERDGGAKILLGVSHALLDLAERYAPKLSKTIVMETGGMKGMREELPKAELHSILCSAFGVGEIHSEYGMAELTSQAYSAGGGVFYAPPWMRIVTRDVNDPFEIYPAGRGGGVNIIDLANVSSCAFIQTQDVGVVRDDGGFEILGRIDRSEIRGCNLLVI